MQKFITNKTIKQFILNNPNLYQFKPYYPYSNSHLYGFSDTYKLKNNPNYKKCNRHKFYLKFTINQQPLKQLLNQLQSQYPNNFKYKIQEVINYRSGELIGLYLITFNLFN